LLLLPFHGGCEHFPFGLKHGPSIRQHGAGLKPFFKLLHQAGCSVTPLNCGVELILRLTKLSSHSRHSLFLQLQSPHDELRLDRCLCRPIRVGSKPAEFNQEISQCDCWRLLPLALQVKPLPLTEEEEASVALYYRWWTFRHGKDYMKFGPMSITWYRWSDGMWRIEAMALCRYQLREGGRTRSLNLSNSL
jgi:hypothetical protein